MKRLLLSLSFIIGYFALTLAQERRPISNEHPMWMIHVDVWNAADPQKIIELVPEDIRPYVCMNLSLSCQFDKEKKIYKMPQNALRTYKSWGTVCQANGMWFTCQPASGGHTHIQDSDLETFEYMFRRFPNFLGWNFAEQFWGFDEQATDLSSSPQASRWALFAKLVEMSHNYGGFLTVSFCGNIWSHALNPIGEMKRDKQLMAACKKYPEAILWLYKYTTSSCFYNNESVTFGPFIAGLAKNYGVRYDNCGWNGAMDDLLGEGKASYPSCAGVGTVMEQCGSNGGAVWDGPELIWSKECFEETDKTTVDGYTRRNWGRFDNLNGVWIDLFRKIIDGTIYIPTREEVIERTKIVVVNNVTSGSDEDKYASWNTLYDGLYKQDDPANSASSYGWSNGQMMSNMCYFKKTGRYGTIAIVPELYDALSKTIPMKATKSTYVSRWSKTNTKISDFDKRYPELSEGDLFVSRMKNQLICYTPYTYLNKKVEATGRIPLLYNTCDTLKLTLGKLGSATVREFSDHLDFYFNNFRTDTTALVTETIVISGVKTEPTYKYKNGTLAKGTVKPTWDAEAGVYTLTLKHLGGATVSINCSGDATEREADIHPVIALPQPVQPAPYHGEIIAEAEDMDYKSVSSSTVSPYNTHPNVRGHAGNGFVEMGNNTSGALRHQLTLKEAGDYRISVRYMNTAKAGQLRYNVNGKGAYVDVEKTAANEWRKATFDVTLKAGKNTLVLSNPKGINMFIDQVIYTPADCEAEKFLVTVRKASNGTVTADVDEAEEGQTVTLTIIPRDGYGLKELKVINGVNFTFGTTISLETLSNGNTRLTFSMPDDIVTLQPEFAKGVNEADPDGIRIVNADGSSVKIYDLNGRQVNSQFIIHNSQLKKGIYIMNGKKIMVK